VSRLSEIERTSEMRALIRLLSARSAQLLIPAALGNEIRLPRRTAERYIGLLEEVFLIKRIPAWSRKVSTRDFRGLCHLAERLGDDLAIGIVLYTGDGPSPSAPDFEPCRSAPSGSWARECDPLTRARAERPQVRAGPGA